MLVHVCKLCRQQAQLCDSHIVPEFFYKELYDPDYKNGKMRMLHTGSDGDDKPRPLQKGYKEHMLCNSCEGMFHEDYASRLFYKNPPIIRREKGIYSGIDYAKFKIFQMSILWRASVANQPSWKYVDLGQKHSDILRSMLLNGDPGQPWEYGCIMVSLMDNGKVLPFNVDPVGVRFGHFRGYRFTIAGMAWYYIIGSQPSDRYSSDFLQSNGELRMQEVKFWDDPFVARSVSRLRTKYKLSG